MTRRAVALVGLALVASSAVVHADEPRRDEPHRDEPRPDGPPPIPPELRRAYEQHDYETVRRELLKQYTLEPRTELLFALGQVELNLGHYEAAIRYYEQFIARNPPDEQVALAQQAIGAARMRMAQPPPSQPSPQPSPAAPARTLPPRQWFAEDTGLVALGGAAVVVGGGLLYYGHRLGDDHGGTLADYDDRVQQAHTTLWTGAGIAAAGALVIGVTVLRWRLRPDGGTVTASVAPGAATFALAGRW